MRVLPFHDNGDVLAVLAEVRGVLAPGGVIVVPTETFYGLAADPASSVAVERILRMKGRPAEMALPILAADWDQVESLVEVPDRWRPRLAKEWPGALTVILPARAVLPVSRYGTLAVRIPGRDPLRTLLAAVGPLSGTSANRHGMPPATTALEAAEGLLEAPDLVLDGGPATGRLGSTIIDLTGPDPVLLRDGPVIWL